MILVGNGGIATEVAHEVTNCQIIWAIKDASISAAYLDSAAAKFFLLTRQYVNLGTSSAEKNANSDSRSRFWRMNFNSRAEADIEDDAKTHDKYPSDSFDTSLLGAALGPDWARDKSLRGQLMLNGSVRNQLKVDLCTILFINIWPIWSFFFMRSIIVYQVQVNCIMSPEEFAAKQLVETPAVFDNACSVTPEAVESRPWKVYVELTNGECYGADIVVSATGVEANFSQVSGGNFSQCGRPAAFLSSIFPPEYVEFVAPTSHSSSLVPDTSSQGETKADAKKSITASSPGDLGVCKSTKLRISNEPAGGLLVNELMQTSRPEIYAVG
ncbi:unnamed protein product, partial [Protopolystoma xenopodis]